MMNSDIKAMVWDMGGVLLRTEDRSPRLELSQLYNLSLNDLDYLVFGNPVAQLSEAGRMSSEERWAFIGRKLSLTTEQLTIFQTRFWAGDRLDEELVSWITSLKPNLKVGLLSNAGPDASVYLRARYPKLFEPFDVTIFSGEIGIVKPDPMIFHVILDRLDVHPDQAIFIDDFKQNIKSAQMVGLRTVWFRSASQAIEEISRQIGL